MGFRIVAVGGADHPSPPEAYARAIRALFGELTGPAWLAWWAPAEQDVLELWCDLDVGEARCSVRRRGDDLVVATVERPYLSVPAAEADALELARRDVGRLVEAIGARLWLDDPPPLPDVDTLRASLAAATAAARDRRERLELLVGCLRDRLGDDLEGLRGLLDAGDDDAVVEVLYVRLLTGTLPLTGPEAAELHALAGGS